MFLVCGEALYDVFVGAGDNPAEFEMQARAGGSPFNVAIGLARLGQPAALLTGISRDELGNRLSRMLEAESVSSDYLLRSARPTTVVMINVDESGQPDYAFYGVGSADCGVTVEDLPDIGPEISGVHFGSYSLVMQPVADAFSTLVECLADRFVSLDPNIRPTIEPDMEIWRERMWFYAAHADMVKISAEDIDALYPGRAHQDLVDEFLAKGVQLVTITDGADEVRCWNQSGLSIARQPIIDNVIDTVGAGDSFQAALLSMLLQWGNPKQRIRELDLADLEKLLDFSVRAASLTCSRSGADLPRVSELSG